MARTKRRPRSQVGDTIDAILTVRGWSVPELARRTDNRVSERTIYAILYGANVTRTTAMPLAAALSTDDEHMHPCALRGLQPLPEWALVHTGALPMPARAASLAVAA